MIMNQRNYQKELEKLIAKLPGTGEMAQEGQAPSLLLHSCCAPCSSYVLEYLSRYFSITVFYYNPNITDPEEYRKRVEEQRRLISELPVKHPVSFAEGIMNRRLSQRLPGGWSRRRRAANAAFGVMRCVWRKLRGWLQKRDMIISPPP